MAIKSEIGDAGFHLWDTWSRQAPSYKPADAKAVWRSISPNGGITIGTLYHEAKANGWLGEAPVRPEPSAEEKLRHQIERQSGRSSAGGSEPSRPPSASSCLSPTLPMESTHTWSGKGFHKSESSFSRATTIWATSW